MEIGKKDSRRRLVYQVHGVVTDDDRGDTVFPIEIIEASSLSLALGVVADRAGWLKGWNCRLQLYRVPFRRETTRPWREDEMQFVCDIDLDLPRHAHDR